MKILVTTPPMHPVIEGDTMKIVPPLAIYVIAGIIRKGGYEVSVCDPQTIVDMYNDGWDKDEIEKMIYDVDVVTISSNSFNWGMAKELIEVIKQGTNPPIVICGGIHPTFFDEYVCRVTEVDYVIRGDAEDVLLKLLDAIEKGYSVNHIPRLTYNSNGKTFRNLNEIKSNRLYDFAKPAYDLIPDNIYYNIPVETSRGCPFQCSFCSILDARNWRGMKAEKCIDVIGEVLPYIGDKTLANSMFIIDNCFTPNPKRAIRILDFIKEIDQKFTFHFEARCKDFLNSKELAERISPEKISTIQMGVECGYDEGLKKVNKAMNINEVMESLKILQAHDLSKKTFLSFMIGLPWEKKEDCIKTIEFAELLEDEFNASVSVNWWMPIKSTLWDRQKDFGFHIDESVYDDALWSISEDIIKSAYKSLSFKDIDDICKTYNGRVSNLLETV
ncbi:B12-binding domain-containing radical SAM protein [Wukongibacter sp. M2B1]|uniref:B12-binding domain-containing radical SAM protein n=1 Tax=Wukongibacter sp. M2B1 TaxID=3088895 RepID=UPI003D78FB45